MRTGRLGTLWIAVWLAVGVVAPDAGAIPTRRTPNRTLQADRLALRQLLAQGHTLPGARRILQARRRATLVARPAAPPVRPAPAPAPAAAPTVPQGRRATLVARPAAPPVRPAPAPAPAAAASVPQPTARPGVAPARAPVAAPRPAPSRPAPAYPVLRRPAPVPYKASPQAARAFAALRATVPAKLWPSRSAYFRAVQERSNLHPSLQGAELVRGAGGAPEPASGSFSSAYRLRYPDGTEIAMRVFHPPAQARDRADVSVWRERFQRLFAHLETVDLPPEIVEAQWLDDGIRIGNRSVPVMIMPWVEARTMDAWIGARLATPEGPAFMEGFAANWRSMIAELHGARIAHGDLHHGNVLFERGSGDLRLIDYDAMWAPTLEGLQSSEIGHPNYQHPSHFHPDLRARTYGPEIDGFSSIVVYTTAIALQHDPGLWARFHRAEDHLLFTHEDYRDPDRSPVFQALRASPDATVRRLVGVLADACRGPADAVPSLEDALAGPPAESPLPTDIAR